MNKKSQRRLKRAARRWSQIVKKRWKREERARMKEEEQIQNELINKMQEQAFEAASQPAYLRNPRPLGSLCQWTTSDGKIFRGASISSPTLPPGFYDIAINPTQGLFFQKLDIKTEGLIRFPDTAGDLVLEEIKRFWDKGKIFHELGLTHKRGIIFYGAPGHGKSSTILLMIQDVCSRGGIAIKFNDPNLFLLGMRMLREIQPETPVVVLMEDIDSIIEMYNESTVLNMLDGVENTSKCLFLASTNYPEKLGPRIMNRPSRFDKRIKIEAPSAVCRRMYFEHLIPEEHRVGLDLTRWTKDSEGLSFAHMRELFIAVVILGNDYEQALENLRSMREHLSSDRDYQNRKSGFRAEGASIDIGFDPSSLQDRSEDQSL